jgi:hypothetical protein
MLYSVFDFCALFVTLEIIHIIFNAHFSSKTKAEVIVHLLNCHAGARILGSKLWSTPDEWKADPLN